MDLETLEDKVDDVILAMDNGMIQREGESDEVKRRIKGNESEPIDEDCWIDEMPYGLIPPQITGLDLIENQWEMYIHGSFPRKGPAIFGFRKLVYLMRLNPLPDCSNGLSPSPLGRGFPGYT